MAITVVVKAQEKKNTDTQFSPARLTKMALLLPMPFSESAQIKAMSVETIIMSAPLIKKEIFVLKLKRVIAHVTHELSALKWRVL